MTARTAEEARVYNRQHPSMRIRRDLRDRLQDEARRRDLGPHVLLERAVERALEQWEAQEL
jgi:predicted transcriptional regulator